MMKHEPCPKKCALRPPYKGGGRIRALLTLCGGRIGAIQGVLGRRGRFGAMAIKWARGIPTPLFIEWFGITIAVISVQMQNLQKLFSTESL